LGALLLKRFERGSFQVQRQGQLLGQPQLVQAQSNPLIMDATEFQGSANRFFNQWGWLRLV
jgi:hypothetical protein